MPTAPHAAMVGRSSEVEDDSKSPMEKCSWVRAATALLLSPAMQVAGEFCENGIFCATPKMCCGGQCCVVDSAPETTHYTFYHLSFWNMWYFWFIVIFLVISCFGGCGYWRRRHVYLPSSSGRSRRSRRSSYDDDSPHASTDGRDTPSAAFPCLQYTPQGSFPAPPPYSEVAAKPDLYPLVQGANDYKDDVPPYSYTNTPYIHNFMLFNSGPLCPSSPGESICSSLPFSTNQTNSVCPPPYSDGACTTSNLSTPGSMLSAYTPTDVSSLHLAPSSPPVATTPSSQQALSSLASPSLTEDGDDLTAASDPGGLLLSSLVADIQSMTSRAADEMSPASPRDSSPLPPTTCSRGVSPVPLSRANSRYSTDDDTASLVECVQNV